MGHAPNHVAASLKPSQLDASDWAHLGMGTTSQPERGSGAEPRATLEGHPR